MIAPFMETWTERPWCWVCCFWSWSGSAWSGRNLKPKSREQVSVTSCHRLTLTDNSHGFKEEGFHSENVIYVMRLALYAVSESVETGITLFVSNHLDRASMWSRLLSDWASLQHPTLLSMCHRRSAMISVNKVLWELVITERNEIYTTPWANLLNLGTRVKNFLKNWENIQNDIFDLYVFLIL